MARGADEAAWNRTRALAEVVWVTWQGKPLPDGICEPYGRPERVLSPQQAADNMADLMGALGRLYGGR